MMHRQKPSTPISGRATRISDRAGHVTQNVQDSREAIATRGQWEPDVVRYLSYLTINLVFDIKAKEVARYSPQSAPATDEV